MNNPGIEVCDHRDPVHNKSVQVALQLVDSITKSSAPQVLKAKHLKRPTRRLLVSLFDVHESARDAARAMSHAGISAQVIIEVVLLDLVRERSELLRRLVQLEERVMGAGPTPTPSSPLGGSSVRDAKHLYAVASRRAA